MDLKLLNEELVRLHDALAIGANQDVPLAKWAMERITAIHEAILTTRIGIKSFEIAKYDTAKTESNIKAKDVIEGTWMDSTGLIWHPATEGTYTHKEALDKAEELGLRLPTKEEFERAEKEGIRAMFNDFKDRWFWSSSERASGFAWSFSGYNGVVSFGYRDSVDGSVRYVGRGIKFNL